MALHSLTTEEERISKEASKELGYKVIVFRDGGWICHGTTPSDYDEIGYGSSSKEAIANWRKLNAKLLGE
jgi:hypothetical protein